MSDIATSVPSRTVAILNKRGLHARAAAKFVQTVSRFQAEIQVSKDGQTVPGASIMGLMMLAATIGTSITMDAQGADAEAALDALTLLVEGKFGEE